MVHDIETNKEYRRETMFKRIKHINIKWARDRIQRHTYKMIPGFFLSIENFWNNSSAADRDPSTIHQQDKYIASPNPNNTHNYQHKKFRLDKFSTSCFQISFANIPQHTKRNGLFIMILEILDERND